MRQQENFQLLLQFLAALFRRGILLLTQRFQLRVGLSGHQFGGVEHILPGAAIGAKGRDDRLQLFLLFQIGRGALGIGIKIRLFGAGTQFQILFLDQFQLLQHRKLQKIRLVLF